MNLAAINWRSPVTWIVVIGGGVAVYLLFRYFQNQNAANASTSAATSGVPTSGASIPAVGTSLYLEAPSVATDTGTTGTTPGTATTPGGSITYPGGTTVPVGGLTYTPSTTKTKRLDMEQIVQQEYGFAPESAASTAAIAALNTINPNRNFGNPKNFPGNPFTVPQVDPTTGALLTSTPTGSGVPDVSNYVHVSTWPYGGQKVTSRLG